MQEETGRWRLKAEPLYNRGMPYSYHRPNNKVLGFWNKIVVRRIHAVAATAPQSG